jgi:GNAT superfamily N-acetyltransferase
MSADPSLERIDGLGPRHVEDLLELFRHEWWTRDRQPDDVRRLLDDADVVVGYRDPSTRRLVAFARVKTTALHRALVMDVIVAAHLRGRGVGMRLLDAIIGHPALRRIRHFELNCRPELTTFYARRGFVEELRIGQACFMRLTHRP